jgi:thiol:disulfide interchange protein DsbC
MKSLLILAALLLPFNSWASDSESASSSTAKTIRSTLSDMTIKAVNHTPISGLYELQVGDQIYYTDKMGRHIVNGHIFDTKTKQDLTATRLADLNRINWSDLPLDQAVVSGDKDGMKMAVFTDPDCPYCKQLEQRLTDIEGVRVYTFLFPLVSLHPDAFAKSESIWCAKDQHQAMVDLMIKGTELPKATCDTPIAANIELAEKLNVRGTPTIFSEDGRKYTGDGSIKDWLRQGQ